MKISRNTLAYCLTLIFFTTLTSTAQAGAEPFEWFECNGTDKALHEAQPPRVIPCLEELIEAIHHIHSSLEEYRQFEGDPLSDLDAYIYYHLARNTFGNTGINWEHLQMLTVIGYGGHRLWGDANTAEIHLLALKQIEAEKASKCDPRNLCAAKQRRDLIKDVIRMVQRFKKEVNQHIRYAERRCEKETYATNWCAELGYY